MGGNRLDNTFTRGSPSTMSGQVRRPRDQDLQLLSIFSACIFVFGVGDTMSAFRPEERVRCLSYQGSKVEVRDGIPVQRYFRSGKEMLRMAGVYQDEDNFEEAFILYTKFITLFVEKLPEHCDYKSVAPQIRAEYTKKLKSVFPIAEGVKKKLIAKYSQEYQKYLEHEEREKDHFRALEDERQRLDAVRQQQREEAEFRAFEDSLRRRELERERLEIVSTFGTSEAATNSKLLVDGVQAPPVIPADRQPSHELQTIKAGNDSQAGKVPVVDRSCKPVALSREKYVHAVHGLRRITVPRNLHSKFLEQAVVNTERGIETCGILCGKMTQAQFRVTHVILPKQVGGTDSCVTENEEELFTIQDMYELLTIGWIHTHPTQTAFLSSVDLHTHCSYQLMLPEAIAIVCSPRHGQTGTFQLTDRGMEEISDCRKEDFHPHTKEPPLFQVCEHVLEGSSDTIILDLR
uniref:STAM binding protein a n=2 Tax=Eptatretus burgeri TaxID=7764 RepID=A0A8C4RAM3_EPTBU